MRALPAALCALALAGCGEAGIEFTEPAAESDERDLTFRGGVVPTINALGCRSCHNGTTFSSNLDLDAQGDPDAVYANLLAGGGKELAGYGDVVDVTAPADSLLLLAPLPGSSYSAHANKFFSDEEDERYLTILGWIQAGAPDD